MNNNSNHKKKPMIHFNSRILLTSLLAASAMATVGETQPPLSLKTEHFDRDPGWDNSVNRVEASDPPTVTQDFGWSPGKIGGQVRRSMTPAWVGMPLERTLTFKDAFSASGKISATPDPVGKGTAYLGFFNHERQGWRPWSTMVLRFVHKGDKLLIYMDVMSGKWNATAAEMDLSIPTDGSEHTWRFNYDPDAARAPWADTRLHGYLTSGRQTIEQTLEKARKLEPDLTPAALEERLHAALKMGLVTFLRRGGGPYWLLKQDKETLKGLVTVQVDDGESYGTYLDEALRDTPVELDRFGIFNMQLTGGSVTFHVSDLEVNERKINLAQDPGWEGRGNRVKFVDRDFIRQNFGYGATNFAGGAKGEIGGIIYNVEPTNPLHGYYADDIGRLTLEDPIHFSGKTNFIEGSTDAGMFIGFFRAEDEKRVLPPNSRETGASGWPQPNVLGVVIDGPARIGWWFIPTVTAADRKLSRKMDGTVFLPTREHRTFDFVYDPQANKGVGRITVTLDGQPPILLDLTPEQRKAGATFDRFGLTSFRRGGKFTTIYFDDLTYTTRRPADAPPVRHEQKITTVPYPR